MENINNQGMDHMVGLVLSPQKLIGYSPISTIGEEKMGVNGTTDKAKHSVKNNKKKKSEILTGLDLLNMNIKSIPTLVDPIMPKGCLMALIGSSDIGKSSLLLQLCTDIALHDKFLGFKINATHGSTIYVSTEDDDYALSYRLQHLQGCDDEKIKNMRFIFNSDDLVKKLDGALSEKKADLVAIDTWGDIFRGQMNQINQVRSFMNDYFNLAIKHKCAIIFNHHTGKYTEEKPPSKTNSIGSAGFEGKVRLLMELRQDFTDSSKRHLCLVKANYLAPEFKSRSYELDFDPIKGFTKNGRRKDLSDLVRPQLFKPMANRDVEKSLVTRLHKKGRSARRIELIMKRLGYSVGKSTVSEWMK